MNLQTDLLILQDVLCCCELYLNAWLEHCFEELDDTLLELCGFFRVQSTLSAMFAHSSSDSSDSHTRASVVRCLFHNDRALGHDSATRNAFP